MGHFYVWKFSRRNRLITLLTLSLICAFILFLKPYQLLSVFSKEEESVAITRGDGKENKVSLTFNISWGDEKVHDILKVLKENDIQATFFLSGEWAERHPQIVEKIAEQNHEIGMLGYRYESYVEQDIETVKKDIQEAIQIFNKLGFDHINYIRPPSGHFNDEILKTIEQIDLEAIHWSVHPNDWENPGVTSITSHLHDNVDGGDIILMHASDSAKQTAEALSQSIPHLQERDLKFVTLSELLDGITLEKSIID